MIIALALAAGVVVRTEVLPREAMEPDPARRRPVRVVCVVGKPTRIVFPEPLVGFKASGETKANLGLRPLANAPLAIFVVTPTGHPAKGAFEFKGRTLAVTIVLETAEKGEAQEIRLQTSAGASPSPSPTPAARAVSPPPPSPRPTPTPSAPRSPGKETSHPRPSVSPSLPPASPPTTTPSTTSPAGPHVAAAPSPAPTSGGAVQPPPSSLPASPASSTPPRLEAVDVRELALLNPIAIGRREGLPGERVLVLTDALRSDKHVWLRFTLEGGAKEKVEAVSWEHGSIPDYMETAVGKDLRLVVRLSRLRVTKKTRVTVKVAGGGTYRFAISAPWFSTFLRELF